MDDDFFHPESLLHIEVGLIQSIFAQSNRVAVWFGVGAERQMQKSPIKLLSSLCTCCAYSTWSHFLPIGKTVGGCQDPAGRDQTAPATENLILGFATPKYGSNPRVGFHSGKCSTHNLHLFSGALATSGFCSWWGWNKVQNSRGKKHRKAWHVQWSVNSPVSGSVGAGEGGAGTERSDLFRLMKHLVYNVLGSYKNSYTHQARRHNVECHNIPRQVADFSEHNTTGALYSLYFCRKHKIATIKLHN